MDLEFINAKVLFVYKECNISGFPIDCFDILRKFGYRIRKYSDLTPKKKAACQKLSKDACLISKTLYYEDKNIWERTRFSVMHELGHHILETESEDEADCFASYVLAPRIIVHKKHFRTAEELHQAFGISYAAANRTLVDYKTWFEHIAQTTHKPSESEQQMEEIFCLPLDWGEINPKKTSCFMGLSNALADSQQWYYSSGL